MATKEKKDVPTAPQTPSEPSNIRSYFTREVREQITEMTPKEMESVMKDLINTRHWIAILKYTSMRTPLLDATLRGTNPTQDPHKISWSQGAMAGLCDIEGYVIDLNASRPPAEPVEEGEPAVRTEGVIVG